MGQLDLEGLLRPVSDAAPCGDNLEYDVEFGELDRAARTTPEQVIGNTVVAAEPPDWQVVLRRATDLFSRTKDLRVAMQLVKALLVTEGIIGFRDGLELLARLLTECWDSVHPQLDPEDDNDPTLRVNVFSELCGEAVLRDLRSVPLARSQALGTATYRDIALATGELKPVDGAKPKSMSEIHAVFLDCDADELLAMAAAALTCVHRLTEIETTLSAKVSAARAFDFSPVLVLMRGIVKFLQERVSERGLIIEPEPASEDTSVPAHIRRRGADAAPAAVPHNAEEITSRDEVVRLLDRICAYYEKFEPSSPVPLLLTRAKRLVAKNFIDVLRDIAPDAVAQAEAVRGRDGS